MPDNSPVNLYLVRHGKAERPPGYADPDRQLTDRGRDDMIDLAIQFAAREPDIDRCLVSPYVRALQSAELLFSEMERTFPVETEALLTPERSAEELMLYLEALGPQHLVLVGHNPILTTLFGLATAGRADFDSKVLKTAELACLSWDAPGAGRATYEYGLHPHRRLAT